MEAWLQISKAEAIEAVRRRARETGRAAVHTFDRRFDGTWRSTFALEYAIMQSESTYWASAAPYHHELVIVEDHQADKYLFIDVQRLPPTPLITRRAESIWIAGARPRHSREDR